MQGVTAGGSMRGCVIRRLERTLLLVHPPVTLLVFLAGGRKQKALLREMGAPAQIYPILADSREDKFWASDRWSTRVKKIHSLVGQTVNATICQHGKISLTRMKQ